MTKIDSLKSEMEICDLQMARMEMAYNQLKGILPLTKDKYLQLTVTEISFLDMISGRFAKLQDLIGSKIFPKFLERLEENTEGKSAIDRLHLLEKLGYLKNTQDWIEMRTVRNSIAHEYPDNPDLMVANLNKVVTSALALKTYWQQLRIQIREKLRDL